MSAPDVVQWICIELTRLLGVDATEDIAQYILTFEDANDLKDYMHELLDPSIPRNKRFVDELLRKWRPPPRHVAVPGDIQFYRKTDEDDSYVSGQEKSKPNKRKTKNKNPSGEQPITAQHSAPVQEVSPMSDQKKKQKFVPLFSKEGQERSAVRLPGRHVCECQAVKHALVSNCLKCGRVVCDQEGSGPCLFCGALVCTKEEQEILARGSKKSDKLLQQLMQQKGAQGDGVSLPHLNSKLRAGLEKAVQHKDKLLHYDKTSVKRTQVIDDESDYFSTGSQWLSKEERKKLDAREEELRSKRFASRKDRKITLDFAGRKVLDDEEIVNMYNRNDETVRAVQYGDSQADRQRGDTPSFTPDDFSSLVNPNIVSAPPKFVETELTSIYPSYSHQASSNKQKLRLQDRELQEMCDEGMCMSMHQPYASLLVAGVKIHEGRSWFTPHRGRLWIAAASKQPTVEEIAEVELFYRHRGCERFPEQYPVSCLLGCVDVVDCLAQDTYRNKFPDGESMSPFVFICENPQELIIKFPMKGKHKIYKLDSRIHQAGKKGLAHRHET